jgi:hypothetical protein
MRKINQLSSRSVLGLRLGIGISAAALVFTVVLPNAALARRGGELESSDDNRNRTTVRIDDDNDRRLNTNRGPGNGGRCDIRINLSNDGRRGRGRDENKIGSRSMHHIRGRSFTLPNNSLNSQRSIDDNEDNDAVVNDRQRGRDAKTCVRSTTNTSSKRATVSNSSTGMSRSRH